MLGVNIEGSGACGGGGCLSRLSRSARQGDSEGAELSILPELDEVDPDVATLVARIERKGEATGHRAVQRADEPAERDGEIGGEDHISLHARAAT